MKLITQLLATLMLGLLLASCGSETADPSMDDEKTYPAIETEADADMDSDMDADADMDMDSEMDSEMDSDMDADSDTEDATMGGEVTTDGDVEAGADITVQ